MRVLAAQGCFTQYYTSHKRQHQSSPHKILSLTRPFNITTNNNNHINSKRMNTLLIGAIQSTYHGTSLESNYLNNKKIYIKKRNRRINFVTKAIFEKFTEPTIKVVIRAQKEAQRLGDSEVQCYHIFLGLIEVDNAVNGFMDTGVTLDNARKAITLLIGDHEHGHDTDVPFSDDVKLVFESAMQVTFFKKNF